MLIITKTPGANGAYPPLQDWNGPTPPETHYQLKTGLDTSVFTQNKGFVTLTVIRGIVTAMTPNTEALETWKAAHPVPEPGPEPEPEPEPGGDMSGYATWDALAQAYREGVNAV